MENLFEQTLDRLDGHIATRSIRSKVSDPSYDVVFGERICRLMFEMCGKNEATYHQAVDDFIAFSLEFLQLQAELDRTGTYKFQRYADAKAAVYDNPEVMAKRYLNGLLLSQAFWMNHSKIFHFFRDRFCAGNDALGSVLEVPVGTGIFLSEFSRLNPNWRAVGNDISDSAIIFAKRLMKVSGQESVVIDKQNVFELPANSTYKRIVCGELLEHVENPTELLSKLRELLDDGGKIFLTTAIWAASLDHIYLFKSAQEVRDMLQAEFILEAELVLPVFQNKKPEDEKTPINYACILTKR